MVEANRCSADGLICFLIGNKIDLVAAGTPRAVTDQQVQEKADTFMTNAMHVSALTGEGCEEAFKYITDYLIQHAKGSKTVGAAMILEGTDDAKPASTSTAQGGKKKKEGGKCMC